MIYLKLTHAEMKCTMIQAATRFDRSAIHRLLESTHAKTLYYNSFQVRRIDQCMLAFERFNFIGYESASA